MKRMRTRGGQAVAAIMAGTFLAGCAFAVVPPKKHAGASASPTASLSNPYPYRLADAPALLTQCAVDTAGLSPGTGLDWFANGQVTINTSNAGDFASWWSAHRGAGPYPQTFVIGGRRTHYLEFGPTWVKRGSLWVPDQAGNKTLDMDYSLAAWTAWAAVNGKLPTAVCGTSDTARQLQAKIFGNGTPNPW